MDNARGHRTNDSKQNYINMMKKNFNIEIVWQVPNSPEFTILVPPKTKINFNKNPKKDQDTSDKKQIKLLFYLTGSKVEVLSTNAKVEVSSLSCCTVPFTTSSPNPTTSKISTALLYHTCAGCGHTLDGCHKIKYRNYCLHVVLNYFDKVGMNHVT